MRTIPLLDGPTGLSFPSPAAPSVPAGRNRLFYDTEFLENGHTINLISIGMVGDDGRELYAINRHADWSRICDSPWLVDNVLPSLPGRFTDDPTGRAASNDWVVPYAVRSRGYTFWTPDFANPAYLMRPEIAGRVAKFILSYPKPELWAWYAAFDHVALAWLWGPMAGLPEGIPMFTCDLKQEAVRQGDPELPEQPDGVHNALADARHNVVRARALGLVA